MSFLSFLKDSLPIVAPLAGAAIAANASNKASKAQVAAANQAAGEFRPYAATGDHAAQLMRNHLTPEAFLDTFSADDFTADPGYQFQLAEGEKAINRNMGARGKRLSGQAYKELLRFNNGLANQTYNQAYDRHGNDIVRRYNTLAGVMNLGQGASGNIGNALISAGDNRAAGTIGQSNALINGINNAVLNYQLRDLYR